MAKLGGQVAAWKAERSGVTLLRFDQSLTQLTLHAGLGKPSGSWGARGAGVPAHGQPIASVLQNLSLLVDHGRAAGSIEGCIQSCWGATVGGVDAAARSALGIDGAGRLVWAAGESLLPSELARALIAAGVQRAVELDINPDWVAGYLYVHGGSGPRAEPVVPGQLGISGRLLTPYTRDFFALLAR